MKRERDSTIERLLDILDTVAASPKPLSTTEINEVLEQGHCTPPLLRTRSAWIFAETHQWQELPAGKQTL
jgi:hypothetical protein